VETKNKNGYFDMVLAYPVDGVYGYEQMTSMDLDDRKLLSKIIRNKEELRI
jgi:hypothetical protein